MILCNILLKNFRSIGDEGGAGITIPLARINYIIGPNGAGKSNIIAGLETIVSILAGGDYEPETADYFDRNPAREMELGAALELSDEERQRLLEAHADESVRASIKNISNLSIFRFVHYSVTFLNGKKQAEKILTNIDDDTFCILAEAHRETDGTTVDLKTLEAIYLQKKDPLKFSTVTSDRFPTTRELVERVDPALFVIVKRQFDRTRILGMERKIASAVSAHEAQGISPDSSNLPAELNNLDRSKQIEFDEYMKEITRGDPASIEPRLRGSELVLEIKGNGLKSRGTHADLGSGQEQTLILGWQLRNPPNAIFIIKEPELHLHPERQKQIRRQLQQADPGLQFVIETHSPIFLGTGEGEKVLLATKSKSEGHTRIAKIAPESMRLIREELGISHADALYNTRVLIVEGESEFAAFPIFWKALGPDLGPIPSLFSLGGAGNTKHLRLILEYLQADDRRFFVILDRHKDAIAHVESLPPDLLPSGNFHILRGSIEDEFTSEQIARAAGELARKAGLDLRLTREDLDAAGSKSGMVKAVKRRWFEAAGASLDKDDLSRELARLCGRDEIPEGIRAALKAAATSLGSVAGAGPEHASPTAGGGDEGRGEG